MKPESEPMTVRDLERLESAITQDLDALRAQLDVAPPATAMRHARTAIHCALAEPALAAHAAPVPSARLMARIRAALRSELARPAVRPGPGLLRWRAWPALGAVAMVLICFGIIRQSAFLRKPDSAAPALETFVQAGERLRHDDAFRTSFLQDLEAVERDLSSTGLVGDQGDGDPGSPGDDLDGLFDDPDALDARTEWRPRSGAVG